MLGLSNSFSNRYKSNEIEQKAESYDPLDAPFLVQVFLAMLYIKAQQRALTVCKVQALLAAAMFSNLLTTVFTCTGGLPGRP
uniref:Uncharacterized protein n=1 Tax=Pyxicephalus adspersus TaxID=30357 RepID=A0AAV3AAT5_PYXAD|nr:TPA: hypothetical protein GDO54_017989 [Pyxicephalus adspersus]